jgi:hypothetical protein
MTTLATVLATFKVADATSPVSLHAGRLEMSRLFSDLGFTKGAEIGVWKGKWSARLCVDNPNLDMLCVDLWGAYATYQDSRNSADVLDQSYAEAVERLSHYRCMIRRQPSVDAAASVPDGSLDFVYIDANHGEAFVRADLEAWVPKVRSGGIVSGHDYLYRAGRPHIQVKAAVDRYVKEHAISPLFVFAKDTVPSFAWVVA